MTCFKVCAGTLLGLAMLPLTLQAQDRSVQAVVPNVESGSQPIVPRVDPKEINPLSDAYPDPPATLADRKTWKATKTQRGTSVSISEADVIKFCSGKDGCIVRLGMHNWDDTGRVASRHFLFFYNKDTRVWRAEFGDWAGANSNNITGACCSGFFLLFHRWRIRQLAG